MVKDIIELTEELEVVKKDLREMIKEIPEKAKDKAKKELQYRKLYALYYLKFKEEQKKFFTGIKDVEQRVADVMEVWEARLAYHTADECLKAIMAKVKMYGMIEDALRTQISYAKGDL